jgi:hypothetical protein
VREAQYILGLTAGNRPRDQPLLGSAANANPLMPIENPPQMRWQCGLALGEDEKSGHELGTPDEEEVSDGPRRQGSQNRTLGGVQRGAECPASASPERIRAATVRHQIAQGISRALRHKILLRMFVIPAQEYSASTE